MGVYIKICPPWLYMSSVPTTEPPVVGEGGWGTRVGFMLNIYLLHITTYIIVHAELTWSCLKFQILWSKPRVWMPLFTMMFSWPLRAVSLLATANMQECVLNTLTLWFITTSTLLGDQRDEKDSRKGWGPRWVTPLLPRMQVNKVKSIKKCNTLLQSNENTICKQHLVYMCNFISTYIQGSGDHHATGK